MIAGIWLILFLGVAVALLGIAPALPRHTPVLHYIAGAVGLVVIVLAVVRIAD